MTTIACNLKELAGDTRVSWEGMGTDSIKAIKVFIANGNIYGMQGEDCSGQLLGMEWLQSGAILANRPEPPKNADWHILELSSRGISIYNEHLELERLLNPYMAIGSGRKVAMYCMKVLGMSPAEAVAEACKVDDYSEAPIYVASLEHLDIQKYKPIKGK